MDDSCVVCAEPLEWVAYGPCGHRDVCSTCVARLRFICHDRRCCICKNESDLVFITKAMGDYTRVISDFSVFPSEPKEGRIQSYWYHEDTQAFFDDVDHYKMVKAMCKLTCNICDNKIDELPGDAPKRRARFGNIEQLKGHLFHKHKLFMCSLCLEGRKAFVCEQKLYTRAQLNQHIKTGDSEVDGTESQRGGFSGHPMCEFCKTPFYGDNELYTHMSSEHYTCHICQRQHPGQFEYYNNYDDLEIHFRQSHFLCEDEACLAKKFIVFQHEAEMKRHNTVEHGGRMSRSKRNAALQIPTSFRYNRSNEQDHRRGRGRGRGRTFRPDFSENQLSTAIEASLETAFVDDTYYDPSTGAQVPHDTGDPSDIDSVAQSLNSLSTADSEASFRYLQALGNSSRSKLFEESLFPPLPTGSGSSQQNATTDSDGSSNSSMAAHLLRKNKRNVTVVNSSQARPAASRGPPSSSAEAWPTINAAMSGVSRGSSQNKANTGYVPGSSTYSSSAQVRPTMTHVQQSTGSLRDKGNPRRITHSASAPNLVESGYYEHSLSDFPPVSATAAQARPMPSSNQTPAAKSEDVQTANKSLVEMIRTALEFDEKKYTAFKDISGQYRQGTIDAKQYLNYVQHFNLTHLVLDLARLCPDSQKQKELIETYNASVRSNVDQGSDWAHSNGSKKGKAKVSATKDDSSMDALADNFMSTVRKLQAANNYKSSDEEVEVLSKDGYRAAKGKSKLMIEDRPAEANNHSEPEALTNYPSGGVGSGSGSKPRGKKTSKFLRVRLGDGSLSDLGKSGTDLDSDANAVLEQSDGNDVMGPTVRGMWRRGGGQKLFP